MSVIVTNIARFVSLRAARNRNVERFSDLSSASPGYIIVFRPGKSVTHQLGLFKVQETLPIPVVFLPAQEGGQQFAWSELLGREKKPKLALYFSSEITGFAINECSKAGKKKMF